MAQTLKFGNGTWATKKGSTLAFNDEDGNYKPLPFTTTRATSATRVNKEGLIEVVENDRPRIDYTDSAKGALLLEPTRTNYQPYSADFSVWNVSGSTVSSSYGLSPDGSNNSSLITEGTGSAQHRISILSPASSGIYTFSCFVKNKVGNHQAYIDMGAVTGFFDFDTKTMYSAAGTTNVESWSNDWYRISITSSSNITPVASYMGIGKNNTETFQGDGSSAIEFFGVQFEQGSYPTSYIPTQGSAVTRVADTASGSGNSEVFNDSEGVLFANIAALTQDNDDTVELCINNGTTNNRLSISFQTATNALRVVARVSGVNQVNRTKTLSDITLFNKIAFKYKQNNYSVFVNGFEILTDTIGTTFPTSTLNTFDFDRADGGTPFYGKTKQIGYYNTILTDLELETLTSYRTWLSMVNELNLNVIYNG